MLGYLSQPSSSGRVLSWLDSMNYHATSLDEDEKSSLASNNSTKNSTTKNSNRSSRRSLSTSSSTSINTNRANVRRIYLRKPRYLIRRFRKNPVDKKSSKNSDQSSSYFSNNGLSADESNVFSSNLSGLNFLKNDEPSSQMPEIKADDLEFDSRHSFTSSSYGSYCSNNYSTNNHQFGILDFENWNNSLKLEEDDLKFKVKTYAFSPKDIKIKVKDNVLIVIGKQSTEEDGCCFKRQFIKKFDIPSNADKKNIKYDFDKNDHLIITVPRTIHSVH